MDKQLLRCIIFLFLVLFGILSPLGKSVTLLSHPELGYDKLLHMIGGVGLGATGIFLGQCAFGETLSRTHGTLFALAMTVTVGIFGWEIWEWRHDVSGSDLDTAGDIIFDLTGCIVAAIVCQRKEGR